MRIWGLVILFGIIGVGVNWISDAGAAMSEAQRKEDARKRSIVTLQHTEASLLSLQTKLEGKRDTERKLRKEVDGLKKRATNAENARDAAKDELANKDVEFCPKGAKLSIPLAE